MDSDPDIQGANMLRIQRIRIQISREPTCCGFNGSGSGYPGSQHVADSMDPDLDIQGANMLRIQWIRIRISREPTCCWFNGSGSRYPGSQHVADSMDPDPDPNHWENYAFSSVSDYRLEVNIYANIIQVINYQVNFK